MRCRSWVIITPPKRDDPILLLNAQDLCRKAASFNRPYRNQSKENGPGFCPGPGYWLDRSCSISRSGFFRMRRADVGELLQNVSVGFQTGGRTLIFRQEGEAVVDHVVREGAAVGVLR